MTIFSPSTVGIDEMRRSISLPSALRRMRPSCGSLRSAMSICPQTFTRETMAECIDAGGRIRSRRTP